MLFMPLAMIRNLAKLSGTALVADAFILIGSESGLWRVWCVCGVISNGDGVDGVYMLMEVSWIARRIVELRRVQM